MNSPLEAKSDEELALDAQSGSRRCYEELTKRYSIKLCHFLRTKIASDQDIEDIIQETFFKLYRNILRYDHKWKFSTWIYTAANRLAISHFRSKRARKLIHLYAEPEAEIQEESCRISPDKNIWEKAKGLKSIYFQALWLRYVEDMPSRDMAKVMKRSDVAVRLLLHRARLNLAKKLQTAENKTEDRSHGRCHPETSNLQATENQK